MTNRSRSRSVVLCSMLFIAATSALAQVPTQCLEIESILADACTDQTQCPGATEGQNEMVRFRTGPSAIVLGDITVTWPNNPWLGLVQNATTASLTATLNATVQGCGRLIEPVGGIIPPGSAVLMVTSTDMCTAANSFTNLGDTLYIVFQAAGNSQGHFLNQNNGPFISPTPTGVQAIRTLVIAHTATNCADTVRYEAAQLTNIFGTYGGNSAENDGATIRFSWPGVAQASYVNLGCQAPFEPIMVSIDAVVGSLCAGGTVELTGSASGNFDVLQWQGGTGTFSDPNALMTTYTPGAGETGNVLLQFCAVGFCGASICADVTLPAGTGPIVTITPDGPIALCPGDSVILIAGGAATYEWGDLQTTDSITVSQSGTYTVTGTNACGQASTQIEITVATGPPVTINTGGVTSLCPGVPLTLTAEGADTYVWSTTDIGPAILIWSPGIYSVTGTSSCGETTASVTITEASLPLVVIVPDGPSTICSGQPVTLIASGADTYVWSTLETGSSIVITQPGTYGVTGSNACGNGTAEIDIIAGVLPDVEITPDGPTALCPGDDVVLTATGADSYEWDNLETTASITVDQPGTYTVTGTNGCGTASAQITVTVGTTPIIVITPDGPTALCPGDEVILTASGADTYEWDNLETTPSITVDQPGTYTVTGTNGCGTASAQITIAEGTSPTVVITPDGPTDLCPGQSVTLTASGAMSYEWDNSETTASITVDQPGTYSVIGTNGCGTASGQITIGAGTSPTVVITPDGPTALCPGEDVILTASGADTYEWDNMETTPSITVDQAGTYAVVGTNGCGTASVQITITVGTSPNVVITPDGSTALCPGEDVTLTASGADTYAWDNSETTPSITVDQPGTYTVTGTNGCGTALAQITISVGTPPVVVITPDGPTDLCAGQSVTLTASGADSYAWDNLETTPSITVDQPGTYSVIGSNACGQASAQIAITAAAGPSVSILPRGPIVLCPGENVRLTASGADFYTWNTQEQGSSITVSQAGNYSVRGTNACGEGSAQVVVSVVDVQASFTASVSNGVAPLSVDFTNTSNPMGVPVEWDFDDGFSSVLDHPTHTFMEVGLYTVSLTVTVQGCASTATGLINVGLEFTGVSEIRVPNIFSPNNDGVNDQLVLWTEGIQKVEMEIINRWGQVIAEVKWPGQRWDARSLAGEVVPDGTYFYALRAVGLDGKDHDLKGTITIVR